MAKNLLVDENLIFQPKSNKYSSNHFMSHNSMYEPKILYMSQNNILYNILY